MHVKAAVDDVDKVGQGPKEKGKVNDSGNNGDKSKTRVKVRHRGKKEQSEKPDAKENRLLHRSQIVAENISNAAGGQSGHEQVGKSRSISFAISTSAVVVTDTVAGVVQVAVVVAVSVGRAHKAHGGKEDENSKGRLHAVNCWWLGLLGVLSG